MPVANGSPFAFLHCFFLSDPTPSLTFFGWPFIIQDIRMSFSSSSSTPTSSPTSISSSSSPRMPSQHSHLFSHDLARRNFSFPSEKLNHNPTTSAACSIARRRWVKRGALLLLAICFCLFTPLHYQSSSLLDLNSSNFLHFQINFKSNR